MRAGSGFTLVELLLAVALVLLLVSAVVFSFSSMMGGAQLDEGAEQFETLVRLSRAQAANSGRRVQMAFEEEVTADGLVAGKVAVFWEPDPLGAPGQFEKLQEFSHIVERVNELVAVDFSSRSGTDEAAVALGMDDGATDAPAWLAPVMFYADGAADSAKVTLLSRDGEDGRRVVLHIDGVTGALRRELLSDESSSEPGALADIQPGDGQR